MNNVAVVNFNIDDMETLTSEQLEQIQSKAMSTRLKKLESKFIDLESRVIKQESKNKGIDIELTKVKSDNEILKKDTEEIKQRVYVFGNNQEDCYTKYKSIAKQRIFKLVGNKGSIKYILFYDSFKLKIHSDVASIISNGKYTKTSIIPDTEVNRGKANGIASKWKPDRHYIREKYNQYFRMYDDNTLKGDKLYAFEKYIEMTNGGRNLEF